MQPWRETSRVSDQRAECGRISSEHNMKSYEHIYARLDSWRWRSSRFWVLGFHVPLGTAKWRHNSWRIWASQQLVRHNSLIPHYKFTTISPHIMPSWAWNAPSSSFVICGFWSKVQLKALHVFARNTHGSSMIFIFL